jgi:hypothetical protein
MVLLLFVEAFFLAHKLNGVKFHNLILKEAIRQCSNKIEKITLKEVDG